MLARIFAGSILCVLLSTPCAAQGQTDAPQAFISDDIGFLPATESRALTSQAALVAHSATKILPFRASNQLAIYKSILNSSAILSGVRMTESDQTALNGKIDEWLQRSARLKPGSLQDAQGALYSGISVQKQDGAVFLEVFVGISDWADVKRLKEQGPVPAFVKSTVWLSVTRKKIDPIADDENRVTYGAIKDDVHALYKGAIDNLLLAF